MSEPPRPRHEGWVDRQIRQARERGEFDDLPGTGKPLDLGDVGDPDWWVKAKMRRENLDSTAGLPTALGLRREAAGYPQSLIDIAREEHVREVIEDYNRRVRADRLRPAVGNLPPLLARILDVDEMVTGWRELRVSAAAARAAERETNPSDGPVSDRPAEPRRPWWRRRRGRG